MPNLAGSLNLPRCPHCQVAKPYLAIHHQISTANSAGTNGRNWGIYACSTCGGVVTAWAKGQGQEVEEWFPSSPSVSAELPERPRTYLSQAQESLHAPAGAVMLAASAVDAMLKLRGLVEGNLYSRIETAVEQHLITPEVAKWAHAVRLDANDQRHADESAPLPSTSDAKRCIDFAVAFGEILFVLPALVQRGLQYGG